jgi:hypothetical protein
MIPKMYLAALLFFGVAAAEPLAFRSDEGLNINSFAREGPVAAHVVLRSGNDPRLLVAFPAGNSGTGLWFDHLATPAHWTLTAQPHPVSVKDAKERTLNGVTFTIAIDVRRLTVKKAVLSSVRVLRDYQSLGTVPDGVDTKPLAGERTLIWRRDRLDGAAGYQLRVAVNEGRFRAGAFEAGKSGRIGLTVTALSGDPPLTPLDASLTDGAAPDQRAREALAFLSYREKFLAGSWRFDTYFGRDTLLSLRLLMPVLHENAIAAGISSVLERLSPDGEVAHEEDIGEFAVIDHRRAGQAGDAPVYDYKMIDENLLLAPVVDAWPENRALTAAQYAALVRNFCYVLRQAAPFAREPVAANLLALKLGHNVGDWRDSEDGLGGGRYPYDVNAVLMPAALEAIAHLSADGRLDPYLPPQDRPVFQAARTMAEVWRSKAPGFFAFRVDGTEAETRIAAYAASLGVPPQADKLPGGVHTFDALALDANGKPVPVLHSDIGFMLLFSDPDPDVVHRLISETMRPFPLGLMTDAGLLVANPALATADVRQRFGPNAYHGTVVWSWQQALFAAGLARQLKRKDLPADARATLIAAQTQLWRVIERTRSFANSELWSWRFRGGHFEPVPFGARGADADESDAAQLWSTVYLAISNPDREAR